MEPDKEFEEIKRRWRKYEAQQPQAIVNEVIAYLIFFTVIGLIAWGLC